MSRRKSDNQITIKDIAAACGVSVSTVSNVINGKTNKVSKEVADRILAVMDEKGYSPNYLAQNLRATSTKTIGVIAEDLYIFSTSLVIEGIMQRAEEMGYNVVIENLRLFSRWSDRWMHNDELYQSALQPVMNKMEALHVDGIVYVAGYEHEVRITQRPEGVPFAVAYATATDREIPCFRIDDEQGGYNVYNYLYSMGHRKIAIIAGETSNTHTVNRLRGIQRAMFEHGILFDPTAVVYQTWNREGGYNGMEKLANEDITAVLCFSDLIAAGVYAYLLEHGKKPGVDLAITGYDDREISSLLYPRLTTVSLSLEDVGMAAVTRVIDMSNPEESDNDSNEALLPATKDECICGELIERDSVFKL
mgnify:FL=1